MQHSGVNVEVEETVYISLGTSIYFKRWCTVIGELTILGQVIQTLSLASGKLFCMVLHKRMLAWWPILQGSLFHIVLYMHMLTQWPSFLEIIILHCTVQVHAGLVAKVSCDSLRSEERRVGKEC